MKQRRCVFFNNGCIHGIRRSELVVVESRARDAVVQDSIAVFALARPLMLIGTLMLIVALVLLLTACDLPRAQKGGHASSAIIRPGQTNLVTLSQPENPKEPSRQVLQSEQALEYLLPAGTAISVGASLGDRSSKLAVRDSNTPKSAAGGVDRRSKMVDRDGRTANSDLLTAAPAAVAIVSQPVPVRVLTKDRSETTIGAAQKDTVREWATKAASVQPVMWAGIAMMTVVAGVLVYFGWWTKAAVAVAVGVGMVVLAQTLPDHGAFILLGGLGVFALAALLVLYAYHKGQLDQNHNGIPDFLERKEAATS